MRKVDGRGSSEREVVEGKELWGGGECPKGVLFVVLVRRRWVVKE